MSTVEDEADPGPEDNVSNGGSDSTIHSRVLNEVQTAGGSKSNTTYTSQNVGGAQNEERYPESKSREDQGKDETGDIQEDGSEAGTERLPILAEERLSSADGSVSTPDDTPSIQVGPSQR